MFFGGKFGGESVRYYGDDDDGKVNNNFGKGCVLRDAII